MKDLLNEWKKYLNEQESTTPFRLFEKQLNNFAEEMVFALDSNLLEKKTWSNETSAALRLNIDFDRDPIGHTGDGMVLGNRSRKYIIVVSINAKIHPTSLEIIPGHYDASIEISTRLGPNDVEMLGRDYVNSINTLSDIAIRFIEFARETIDTGSNPTGRFFEG